MNYIGVTFRARGETMAKGRARRPGTQDEPKYRRLLVGLPPDMDDALRSVAASEDRPLAWVVRQALEHYLFDREVSAA
jgi:hypothetical protein